MDIKIDKTAVEGQNYFDSHARETLAKYFTNYPFIESIRVFFRGSKHPTKKVKLQARLKGKDVFVEASAARHDLAVVAAAEKLRTQAEKYKSKHYKTAS